MTKWDYIRLIASYEPNDKCGYWVLRMLDEYHVYNTQEITLEQSKEFYNKLISN